jgi:anthranilate 1,2-dioxygenase small subunit
MSNWRDVTTELVNLVYDYVQTLDDDRLEEWPDLFVEDGVYRVVPRENLRLPHALPLIFCDNRAMLKDRVLALRTSSVFNLHYDRHLVSNVRLRGEQDGIYEVHSNYALYQTDLIEGETKLFVTGKYEDRIVFEGERPLFKSKLVIVDTYSIPNLLATPI